MDFKAQSTPVIIVGDGKNNSSKPSFFQKIREPLSKLAPNSKKPMALVLTVFILFALALGIYLVTKPTQLTPRADETKVTISLKPQTLNVSTNQQFVVDIFIDTGINNLKPTATQLNIKYDPQLLQAVSFQNGSYFNTDTFQGQPSLIFNNTLGVAAGLLTVGPEPLGCTVQVINGLMPPEQCVFNPKTGPGVIGKLTFKALGTNTSPPTQITFDATKTQMAAVDQVDNVATGFIPATVTFGAQGSPSPSPSSGTTAPEASFTLEKPTATTIPPGQEFSVKVLSRSDIDNANLWNATITFPKNLVEVVRFDKTGSFITSWTEEFFSNATGEISLTGGVTTPGFKTSNTNATMTTIVFRAKAVGPANINIVDPSNIYRNSDNAKILQIKRNAIVQIDTGPASPSPSPSRAPSPSPSRSPSPSPSPSRLPSPSPSPSPSRLPSPSPSRGPKGDGNNDGRIDLQDLSVMFSKWSPAINIISHFQLDFNDDLKINSFDYSEMTQLLRQLGIIRQ